MDCVPADEWFTETYDDPEHGLFVRNRIASLSQFYRYAGSIGEPRRR